MSLREYQSKRNFQRTPEPMGQRQTSAERLFVVQKHAASHLHYDFRLELDGVLKSWAVPKGPCLDPTVKRLAMQVEDHPVEYGSFEGVIPEGEYGGGTVMLWDRGEWEPIGDPAAGYRAGKLHFQLRGTKLRGGWVLVRTKGRGRPDEKRRQWLLFKERDDEARPLADVDILEEMPQSVVTGRNLPDIAADRDRVWGDDPPKRPAKKKPAARKHSRSQSRFLTGPIAVELATRTHHIPAGADWLNEIKFDGYRIICRIDRGHVELLSRNHKYWSERFAPLAEAARRMPVKQAVLDGELVALRPDGVSDFQQLQNALRDETVGTLQYFVFDILHLDGRDLDQLPLLERKQILAELFKKRGIPKTIHLSRHIAGHGPDFFREACKKGLEGIVSKRADSPYLPGRGPDWLKAKRVNADEFVIGGYTDPAGARSGFGALLLGYHDSKGQLIYAGKVGTGYDERTLEDLLAKLKPLRQQSSPFADLPHAPRGTHWVAPRLVAQIVFGSRTREGILRHASFQGLREDKPAQEVTREKAEPRAHLLRKGTRMKRSRTARESEQPFSSTEANGELKQFAGVRLTNPDKVLYPEQGITKRELASYFQAVANWMLPHIVDRPLVLVRCPDGLHKECFYQKHPGAGTPETLKLVPIKEKSKTAKYVVVDNVAGLIALAQVGALEIHAWGSRMDKLERPDRLVFDLDPDVDLSWRRVVDAARQIRDFLHRLGLESFVKTTGGKGLHLVVPIQRRHGWDEVKQFCKEIADAIVRADPDHYTANPIKATRTGKIFVDYLRNGRGATAVVPYSPRARAGAPVSTPLAWDELGRDIRSDHFTINNVLKRLASLKCDPWHALRSLRQSLDGPMKKLRTLIS